MSKRDSVDNVLEIGHVGPNDGELESDDSEYETVFDRDGNAVRQFRRSFSKDYEDRNNNSRSPYDVHPELGMHEERHSVAYDRHRSDSPHDQDHFRRPSFTVPLFDDLNMRQSGLVLQGGDALVEQHLLDT